MLNHVFFATLMAFTSVGFAAGDKSSGCGPGWHVTDKMSFSATTTRGTTNSYVTPFAMTSGTSGCSKHTIAQNSEAHQFIAQSEDQIRLEAAQGQGEYISTLSQNLGCSDPSILGAHLQNNFDELFVKNHSSEAIFLSAQRVCQN